MSDNKFDLEVIKKRLTKLRLEAKIHHQRAADIRACITRIEELEEVVRYAVEWLEEGSLSSYDPPFLDLKNAVQGDDDE